MNSINVYEQALPGLGQRFELQLDDDHLLGMVALRNGRRQLTRRRVGDDEAATLIDLDRDQAVTIGALLLGAQFSLTSQADTIPADQVIVETITIADDAPAIGTSAPDALGDLSSDVAVLAVIRDQTAEIVEHDPDLALCAGDRVAIAARPGRHASVFRALNGPECPPVGST
jgi:TrkA domain protein